MWMLFSLTTLVLLVVGIARRRARRHWDGERRGELRVARFKENGLRTTGRKVARIRVGIAVRPVLEFECRAETLFDEVLVQLGVAQEIQVGRFAFDDAVYLLTDDPAVSSWLRSQPTLTSLLATAFADDDHTPARLRRVVCYDGLLWMEFTGGRRAGREVEAVLTYADAALRQIEGALPATRPAEATGDRARIREAIVLGCSSVLGIVTVGLFILVEVPGWPVVLDEDTAMALGWTAGAGLFAALLGLTFWLLGRRARLPLALLEVCTVGLIGALACGHGLVRDLNRRLDDSPPLGREAVVVETQREQHSSRGRWGSRRTYWRYFATFGTPDGTGPALSISIGIDAFRRFEEGQRVLLVEREGAFGIRWLEDVRPAP